MKITTEFKTLEQLENAFWKEPVEFPSGLVQNCHKYRKIPLNKLTIEQLRLLISQKIGLDYLVLLGIEKLKTNVLAEGDLYEGDLLVTISKVPLEFWRENRTEFDTFKSIVTESSSLLKNQLGEKELDRLKSRINHGI